MSADRALLDTNILIYALDPTSEFHAASHALLKRIDTAGAGLCIAPQNLAEFYAIVTSGRRVPAPRKPEEALAVIEQFLERPGLELLPVPTDVVARWVALARRRPVVGGDLFDIQLIATMLGNGITRIYTFNRDDFVMFSELQVIVPTAGEPEASPAIPRSSDEG
ncbi:MAG: type II toxin-antitoxin system VapC family toxin [Acidobacteriota bacterium]